MSPGASCFRRCSRNLAAGRRPATSITFWMPIINHSSLSGQGEWEFRPARPRPWLPPPPAHSAGLFPFSPALPAAFCPLNGEGAKPDGWLQRGEMTSEPPLSLPSFLCPHLAVCRYERARLKPSGTSNKRRGFGQKTLSIFWG